MTNVAADIDVNALSIAVTAVIAALTGLVTAIAALVPVLKRQKATQETLESVHSIVNGERTATLAYQGQLVDAVKAAGGDVPPSPGGTVLPAPTPTLASPPVDSGSRDGGPVT